MSIPLLPLSQILRSPADNLVPILLPLTVQNSWEVISHLDKQHETVLMMSNFFLPDTDILSVK